MKMIQMVSSSLLRRKDGTILGATIVAARAGEAITELIVAIKHGLKVADLAGAIHAYATYSTCIQQMAAYFAVESRMSGTSGTLIRGISRILR
jgi:pyruvate/2-oxoglutarate dehydrogenase complex dihydrolipoamide dehydrogenase (E3) component